MALLSAAIVTSIVSVTDSSQSPPAPALRAIRARWLDDVSIALERDDSVLGACLVGSLGRHDADDWSDVDLVIVVHDDAVDQYSAAKQLPRCGRVIVEFDARHNAPAGTRAASAQYVIDELPLWVDWYTYPACLAGWVADSDVIFSKHAISALDATFDEHLASRERQPPTPKPAHAHRLLQLALIPGAGKRIARRSPDAARMVEFLGGPYAADASGREHVAALRALLEAHRTDGLPESIAAGHRYLDLVESVL